MRFLDPPKPRTPKPLEPAAEPQTSVFGVFAALAKEAVAALAEAPASPGVAANRTRARSRASTGRGCAC